MLTFRRPDSLARTLESIGAIEPPSDTPNRWTIAELLVIDNDTSPSAQGCVAEAKSNSPMAPIRYIHEPRPGLSAARNRALDESRGDILVFIDDDEVAGPGWPDGLVRAMAATNATLVGGPVRTIFTCDPPRWIVDGKFFSRPEPTDLSTQRWLRSGNLAINICAIRSASIRFDERFGTTGGEDVQFSRHAKAKGLGLSWSATAVVSEFVGPERLSLKWLARRERDSTANWVRVETDQDSRWRIRALIAARSATRLSQGAALVVAGTITTRMHVAAQGVLHMARAVGAIKGIAGQRRPRYR